MEEYNIARKDMDCSQVVWVSDTLICLKLGFQLK